MCTRTGMEDIVLVDLSLDWVKTNIDAVSLKKIMFCGNLGDPCANKDLLAICKHLKLQNKDIVLGINTNGGLQNAKWWYDIGKALCGVYDYVVFSIDGTKETNDIYRKQVSYRKIMANAVAYINAGGSAHWDMLVFDHNKHEVEQCIAKAKELGFSWFRSKESARWDVYLPGTDGLWPASGTWKVIHETAIECEANIDSSRYIDATGLQWPCCHIAEAYHLTGNDDIRKFTSTELLDNYNERLENIPYSICRKACGTTARKGQWRQEINLKEI